MSSFKQILDSERNQKKIPQIQIRWKKRKKWTTRMATAIQGTQTSPFNNKSSQTAGKNVSVFQKSVSAISGAFITSLLVTPLDVVRVRLQSQQPTSSPIINNGVTQPRLGYSTLGPGGRSGV